MAQFVPNSIKDLIFTIAFDGYQVLKFSKSYQCGKWKLKNNDTIAINTNNKRFKHQYILCDIEPVSLGIHCWRAQVNVNTAASVMWAISEKYKYNDRSFESKKQVWGGISTGYIVKNGNFTYDARMSYNQMQPTCQIDMLLNCEAGNFKMGIVGNDKFVTVEFNALPKNYKYGFVPHFNTFTQNAEFRCVKIPHQLFRQPIELPFLNQN